MHSRGRDPITPTGLTIEQTAKRLNYSGRTVYREIKRGKLKTYGAGKLLRVLVRSIQAYEDGEDN